jgi:hypothetical protein
MHVAAADADSVDLHLDVVRPDFLRQVDVAEGEFSLPLKHECAHWGFFPCFNLSSCHGLTVASIP